MKRIAYTTLTAVLLFSSLGGTFTPKNPCPEGMVPATPTACIDKYEWPNIKGHKPLLGLSALPEPYDDDKIMNIDELCKSVGKRPCTAEEWIAACEGPQGKKYPFGDELPKFVPGDNTGLCNYDKRYRGADEYKVFIRDEKEMEYLDQSEPAGNRKSCVSQSGAWDMMGNAEEWVRCNQGQEGWCLASRFWAEPRSCAALITSHSPYWHYYDTSGRCCFTEKNEKKL